MRLWRCRDLKSLNARAHLRELIRCGQPCKSRLTDELGLRYRPTLSNECGQGTGLRNRLVALGAIQGFLARLSKRPWIDCCQPRLTFSTYKERDVNIAPTELG